MKHSLRGRDSWRIPTGVKVLMTSALASHRESRVGAAVLRSNVLSLATAILDRIKVWRIGRQVKQCCAPGLDRSAGLSDLVSGQIVDHDDAAVRRLGASSFFK